MTTSVNFQNLTPSGQTCGICLNKTQDNEEVVGHNYGSLSDEQHEYHRLCITPWFVQGRDTCPLCTQQVSNVQQYLPSTWIRTRKVATIVFGRGILAGALDGTIREVLAFAIPVKISFLITTLAIGVLSLKIGHEIPRLLNTRFSETSRLLITAAQSGAILVSNFEEIPGFGEIALVSGSCVICAGGFSWLLRERRADGILNIVSTGIVSVTSAIAVKVARTAIVQLPGFIAAYIANH